MHCHRNSWLLRDRADWPRQRIDEVIATRRNTPISLARPLPIHLHYDTAWVDEDGTVQFRPDVYGRGSGAPVAEIKEGSRSYTTIQEKILFDLFRLLH